MVPIMRWARKKPPIIDTRRQSRSWLLWGAALGVIIGVFVLYRYNPAENHFYPVCLFHVLTGLECPGCGGLRAIHLLLHGDLTGALRMNPLVLLLIPFGLWIGVRVVLHAKGGAPSTCSPVSVALLWMLFGVMIVFVVLRNLPLKHFKPTGL